MKRGRWGKEGKGRHVLEGGHCIYICMQVCVYILNAFSLPAQSITKRLHTVVADESALQVVARRWSMILRIRFPLACLSFLDPPCRMHVVPKFPRMNAGTGRDTQSPIHPSTYPPTHPSSPRYQDIPNANAPIVSKKQQPTHPPLISFICLTFQYCFPPNYSAPNY